MKKLILALALALSGCAGLTGLSANAELYFACETYDLTLVAINPFKPRMSESQVETVKKAVAVISPVCKSGKTIKEPVAALLAVRDGLNRLAKIEQEVK